MQEHEMQHESAEAKRLYVIVRADIPVGYQMAQACHAAAAIGAAQPLRLAAFPTIVILNAEDEAHLVALASQMRPSWVVPFFEPDLNDEMTAFAVFSDGEKFRELSLAGTQDPRSEVFVAPA